MKNPRPPMRPPSVATSSPRKPPPSAAASSAPSQKPPLAASSSSSSNKKTKSRWESPSKAKPSPNSKGGPSSASPSTSTNYRDQKVRTAPATAPPPPSSSLLHPPPPPSFPRPNPAAVSLPPPPLPYGFQNLDRCTIVLLDGTVRTYFALPPDEPLIDPLVPDRHIPPLPPPSLLNQFGPEGFHKPPFCNRPPGNFSPLDGPSGAKRKYIEEDELARQRMHVLQYGNPDPNPNLLLLGERERHLMRNERDNPRAAKHPRISGDGYDDLHGKRSVQPDNVDRLAVKKAFLKFVKIIYEDADLKKKYLETRKNGPPLHCIACGRFVISY